MDTRQQQKKREWEKLNQKALSDFVPHVDAIFPSLYTFYDDSNGWEVYARQTLQAARGFNKPVYCYLWPQYHDSNKKLIGKYMSVKHWRIELETCRKYSDGIVIWNYEPDHNWDPDAPWWKETLNFLKTLKEGQISK